MKILNEIYTDKQFNNKIFDFYFGDLKVGVFDIETTGLSPKNCQLILSGFALPLGNGSFLSKQIFAESIDEEAQVIEETLAVLNDLDVIITYNGAAFDIPFVQKRMAHHNIKNNYMPYDLDLFKVVKSHSDIKNFVPNLKQKTMENYLGLWTQRDDEIDGGLSVDLYFQYLVCKDIELERQILLHNSDDVKQLYRLLNLLPQTDFHKAMCAFGFPCGEFFVENIKLSTKRLLIEGKKIGQPVFYRMFDDEALIKADFEGSNFSIEVNLLKEQTLSFVELKRHKLDDKDFENCGALYDGFLILVNDKVANHLAITTYIKKLLERITHYELCTDC